MIVQDFIGIFPNAYSESGCQDLISHFELLKAQNLVYDRQSMGDAPKHQKEDQALFLLEEQSLSVGGKLTGSFLEMFWQRYEEYVSQFSVLQNIPKHGILGLKIQKTEPGQGYHVWHFEDDHQSHANRILVFILYLNKVSEGGETEFLYLKKRISPELGTLLIWPAGFTHTHRGNPPLTQTKYILTGWLEWMV